MAALSDYLEKLILDYLMTTGSATRPTNWYVALYTAAPSDSGGGTELSGSGYSREAVTIIRSAQSDKVDKTSLSFLKLDFFPLKVV